MAEERQFIINVRNEVIKKPGYKRARKAVTAIKEAVMKAMKTEKVKIGVHLNELLWSNGRKKPPTRVKVKSKVEDGCVLVELPQFEYPQKKEKKAESKSIKEKLQEKLGSKTSQDKKESQSRATEANKELAKEEAALEKKEHHHKQPGTPEKAKTAEIQKEEKIKHQVFQDKKKDIGEA